MNKKKWFGPAAAAILIFAIVLTGCGSNKDNKGSSSPESTKAPESTAPVKLEIVQGGTATLPPDDFVKKALDKHLNIDMVLTMQNDDQISVRAAGGDYPDLMLISKPLAQKLAASGALLDMTPYLDQLSDYQKFVDAQTMKKGIISGKQYALPRAGGIANGTYWIRKDWLDQLKLQVPTTIDELLAVAKAFTEDDPDGNNKKDTLGMTGTGLSLFSPIFGAFGVTSGVDNFSTADAQLMLKDGKLVSPFYDPGMKEALAAVNKFIVANVVDPEFLNNKGRAMEDKAFQGKFGIIMDAWPGIAKDEFVKVYKEANPKADWVQIAPPKGPDGHQYVAGFNIGATGPVLVIPKALENEPEKLNKVLDLLNYISTEEGNLIVQFGIKDAHFKVEGDKVIFTDQGKLEAGYTYLYQFTGRPELTYLQTKFVNQAPMIDFEAGLPRIETLDGFVEPPADFNISDANRFMQEELVKFIYGKTKLDQYDAFIKTLEDTFGYGKYLESAEQQLKELGVVK